MLRKRGTTAGNAAQVWKEACGYEATTRRPSTITSTLDGEASPWTSSVSYDSNGREATRSFPSGLVVRTDYTSYGQMRQLSNPTSNAVYWTATAADAWGKVTAETFGNGLTGSHVWAASTGQAKQLQWKSGVTTVDGFVYAYDPLGNLKSQQRGGIVESYTYDARQRLMGTTLSSGGGVSFGYSASGNLLRKTDFSAGGNAYSYGGNGCGPHGASSVVMPLGNTVTYDCDANGNVIDGSALTATFDVENRPRTIVRSASGSGGGGGTDLIFKNGFESGSQATGVSNATDGNMSYAYDAKGARYLEIAATRTTRYGPSGYEKVIAGTVTHRHEIGPVVIARVGSTDTVSYVLRDRLGSTIAVSNAAASLTERRQFDAFGKARNADFTTRPAGQANLTATNRGFTSHTQADDVWLVHMNGRVYDQNLGRFLSVDPIIQGGGSQALNPYSYIQNSPLSGTDPSGYAAAKDECAGTKAGGCTEVPLTKAATFTGSHIKGVQTGAAIELVNPTQGGMAELSVAMAGSSSGYVVQASVIEGAAARIAADIGKSSDRPEEKQDRPARHEASENGAAVVGSGGATAQTPSQVAAADQFLLGETINAGQPFCTSACEHAAADAHAAASQRYLGASIASQREAGWNVYQLADLTFTFTFPSISAPAVPQVALPRRVSSLLFDSSGHTHWDSNFMFSPQDWKVIYGKTLNLPPRTLYVSTGDGQLRVADPAYAKSLARRQGALVNPPQNDFPGAVIPGVVIKTTYP